MSMGKKRAVSIIKRDQPADKDASSKPSTKAVVPLANPGSKKRKHPDPSSGSDAVQPSTKSLAIGSLLLQQASGAVQRLLHADASGQGGVTLKSLVLAPHIKAKKAVYAVTVETLKHLQLLRKLLDATQLLECTGLSEAAACVLTRDLLFGEGLKPQGAAERAVLAHKVCVSRGTIHACPFN